MKTQRCDRFVELALYRVTTTVLMCLPLATAVMIHGEPLTTSWTTRGDVKDALPWPPPPPLPVRYVATVKVRIVVVRSVEPLMSV